MLLSHMWALHSSLMNSRHKRRMRSVEPSGDIRQGIILLISIPYNRFLFLRVIN